MTSAGITFTSGSPFLADLRQRVDTHFGGRARTGGTRMKLKTAFWLIAGAALYGAALVTPFPLSLAVWALLGFTLACIGFNVGHDAIHGSASRRSWVNRLLSLSFDVLGASSSTWRVAHNQVHHSFTNITGVDGDLDPGPWMRFSPLARAPRFAHRFQHIYAWLMYGLTALVWVFVKDFRQLREQRASPRVVFEVVALKALHLFVFVGVPLLLGAPVWLALLQYVVALWVAGTTLAVVFQLAHVVEGVAFPAAPFDGRVDEGWADHQMRTTANFGRSRVLTFITGGLDHQIEHHLFPRVSHAHYRALAPIVAACARDHGLPYVQHASFGAAVASHARTLYAFGRPAA
jgi:linoleoyl-CoA desaturase